MEKDTLFKGAGLISLALVGLIVASTMANDRQMVVRPASKELVLKDTLSFSNGNQASSTAKDEIYFDGRIVADAKIGNADAYKINGVDSLAFLINSTKGGSRYITVNVDTYDVLMFDYKSAAGTVKINFGCDPTYDPGNNTSKITLNTYGYHEIIMELWTTTTSGAQASMNNFEFYRYQ